MSKEPTTYYAWVKNNKAHLQSLIMQSNRANTFGAHERTCPICRQGQRIIKQILNQDRSLVASSLKRLAFPLPSKG